MARADLLLALVRAALAADQPRLQNVVKALAAEERHKRHTVLAQELDELLASSARADPWMSQSAEPSQSSNALLELQPKLRLADVALPEMVREDINDLLEEQNRADLLRTYNIEPRHRVLLIGPPGNGKTSTAEAIATELALPLIVLRYEQVITSFLGDTSTRLEAALEQVKRRHCVFFLDEFDALAKERSDAHETGEIKRVVSSLLLQLDRLPSYVILCAATNHPELLDRAVWRRFQIHAVLPDPDKAARINFLRRNSDALQVPLGLNPTAVASRLGARSFADLQEFLLELRRRQILSMPGHDSVSRTTERLLARWDARSQAE